MTDRRARTYGQWWDAQGEYVDVSLDDLTRFGRAAYETVGAAPADAAFLFDTNLDKAIQGDHARGLAKLPGIIRSARAGALDVHPTIKIVRERGATERTWDREAARVPSDSPTSGHT